MARILVVEDDPDVRLVVEHVLLDAGHAVEALVTVAEGRRRLDAEDYDLLLADGRLADGTGMELADQAAERGIPALIITGYAFILRELAGDPTKYRVLLKPMRPKELLYAVEQALADHAAS
jgi:DNA-binding NtrC family response regulator